MLRIALQNVGRGLTNNVCTIPNSVQVQICRLKSRIWYENNFGHRTSKYIEGNRFSILINKENLTNCNYEIPTESTFN